MNYLSPLIGITGDEDGGITGECAHYSHPGTEPHPVIYHGWSAPADVPPAKNLNDFLQKLYAHDKEHA